MEFDAESWRKVPLKQTLAVNLENPIFAIDKKRAD